MGSYYPAGSSIHIDGDVTLYAIWAENLVGSIVVNKEGYPLTSENRDDEFPMSVTVTNYEALDLDGITVSIE